VGQAPRTSISLGSLLRKIISCFTRDWVDVAWEIYQGIRQLMTHASEQGVYEIIEYDSTLELVDPKGKEAIFKRRQKVKFLQDNIIVFQDHAWGDGDIFANYKCSPGFVVDKYQEGYRWNILISLRETKSKGDITDFYIERTVRNGYLKDEEWWQVEIWCKTDKLTLSVIFSQKRPCKRAILQTRRDNKTIVLDQSNYHHLPDGRQKIFVEIASPAQADIYTIRWTW
jgi:hypothetical protein